MNRLLFATLLAAVATASVVNDVEPSTFEVVELDEYGSPIQETAVPESRQNLNLGVIGAGDRRISRIRHNVAASAFVLHDHEITFRGVDYTNITAIRVTRQGSTQNAVPSIIAGGLRQNYVIIRIKGVRGSGIDYIIEIYSSVGCSV